MSGSMESGGWNAGLSRSFRNDRKLSFSTLPNLLIFLHPKT
jgi:hypothetical protein